MAGLGAKLFSSFSKLTAAQVNGYLMDQSIMRFANAAARDAAFGGAGEPTLAEGMTCYLDDTNVVQSYNGSVWVSIAASSTVADVSSALVYIGGGTFSGTTNNVPSIFSEKYDNYRIVLNNMTIGASGYFSFRMLAGTTPLGSAQYYSSARGFDSNGTARDLSAAGASIGYMQVQFSAAQTNAGSVAMDIFNPFAPKVTFFTMQGANFANGCYTSYNGAVAIDNTTPYDGLQFLQSSGATTVGATYRIYGYRQA